MKPEYSSSQHSGECAALQAVLTAYFDGEAGAGEREVAQAHLQSCAACTKVLHEWQSTRALLEAAPVAPMPATLLSQLRLAMGRTDEGTAAAEYSATDRLALEETLFEYARGWEPEPFTPPLQKLFGEVAPPPGLKAEILKLTVGAPEKETTSLITQLGIADLLNSWRGAVSTLLAPRPLRWAGALAVPAMTAWLIVMTTAPQPTSAPVNVAIPESTAVQVPEVSPQVNPSFRLPLIKDGKSGVKPNAMAAPRIAVATFPNPAAQGGVAARLVGAALTSESEKRRIVGNGTATARNTQGRTRSPLITVSSRASGKGRSTAPVFINSAISRDVHSVPSQVTQPEAIARPVPAEPARFARVDEAFESPDDLRAVVDSFRAALISDEPGNDDEELEDDML